MTDAKRACRLCAFFVGDKRGGECHRNPPTMVLAPSKNALGVVEFAPSAAFPPVMTETWCGEYAPAFAFEMPSRAARAIALASLIPQE
jgi:hypothetical protein